MTLPRYDKKRRLEKAGFTHLSGWVRNEDAPRIRKALERGEAEAQAVLNQENQGEEQNGTKT
jgi:hypothetical protein